MMGEMSFTHVVMMGIGGYSSAILMKVVGFPFCVTLPVGGIMAAAVAFILTFPLLRMKGFYFFIGSFAAGEVIRLIWGRFSFFGGYQGIFRIPKATLFGIDVVDDLRIYYFVVLVVTLVSLWIMYRVEHSRIGMAIKAVAAYDLMAESVGINLRYYKSLAFVIGSFFAGVSGVALLHRVGSIDPSQFVFTANLFVIVCVLLGGTDRFAGSLIGLAVLTAIEQLISGIGDLEQWVPLVYGTLLILTMRFMPEGLLGLPNVLRKTFGNASSDFN